VSIEAQILKDRIFIDYSSAKYDHLESGQSIYLHPVKMR